MEEVNRLGNGVLDDHVAGVEDEFTGEGAGAVAEGLGEAQGASFWAVLRTVASAQQETSCSASRVRRVSTPRWRRGRPDTKCFLRKASLSWGSMRVLTAETVQISVWKSVNQVRMIVIPERMTRLIPANYSATLQDSFISQMLVGIQAGARH